jgi:hypothetical protein
VAKGNGTKDETGRIRSYPAPPREMVEACEAEFEATALAAFPLKFC